MKRNRDVGVLCVHGCICEVGRRKGEEEKEGKGNGGEVMREGRALWVSLREWTLIIWKEKEYPSRSDKMSFETGNWIWGLI